LWRIPGVSLGETPAFLYENVKYGHFSNSKIRIRIALYPKGGMNMSYIRCARCGKSYERKDEVELDISHSVLHKECPNRVEGLEVIDEGTFEEIVLRYPFFDEKRL
jgi:hypothetical protein